MLTKNNCEITLKESVEIILNKFMSTRRRQTPAKEFFDRIFPFVDNDNPLLSTPWNVSWQVDAECNLRCKHCFFEGDDSFYNKKQDISTEQALKLTDELAKDFSIVNLTITGGEPLLRQDIFEIISALKRNNVVLGVQTNGTLVDDKIAKKLSSILNTDLDCVQVSLDGASEGYHNRIRGNGVFKKTINGIKNLVAEGIPVVVNCTALSTNINEIPELYKLCAELGVARFSLTRFTPVNDSQNYLIPDPSELFKCLAKTITLSECESFSLPFDMQTVKFFDLVCNEEFRNIVDDYIAKNNIKKPIICDNLTCHMHNSLYINCDGTVHFCFLTKENDPGLGDFKKESLVEIWDKRWDNEFFKARLANNMLCKKCKYFAFCKGGCMASAYNSYQNKDYPDGLCLYAKEQFNI